MDQITDGVLAFPLTPFHADGGLDLAAYERHLEHLLEHQPGAVFAACGTGEYAALSPEEHASVVARTVDVVAGRTAVFAGVGVNAAVAADQAGVVARAGADGVLLLPPYLASGPQAGLEQYVRTVAKASDLPMVLYQRGTAVYAPETLERLAAVPAVVGLKDGLGDLERVRRLRLAVGDEVVFFNGLPTAELQAEAFRAAGAPLYSSAVFAMAPGIAARFYRAYTTGESDLIRRLLREFYAPLAALRDRVPGYAVSLIKAGAGFGARFGARGTLGSVRPPLADPATEHLETLRELLYRGTEIVEAAR